MQCCLGQGHTYDQDSVAAGLCSHLGARTLKRAAIAVGQLSSVTPRRSDPSGAFEGIIAMSDQASQYRDALLQYERTLRDLAHESLIARTWDAVPPATFTSLSEVAGSCTEVLEHFQGQRMPSDLHRALTQVTRAIGLLARALQR